MHRSKPVSWVVAAIFVVAGSLAGLAHAAATADEAAIRAQTTSWEKAYNGGDAKGVAAQYADDALLLPPGASGVSGKPAILEFFTKDIATSKAAGAVFVLRSQDRCRGLWQHGLGIGHVQGDRKRGCRRDGQVPVGLAQERRQVALSSRHMECGCASRSGRTGARASGTARRQEIGRTPKGGPAPTCSGSRWSTDAIAGRPSGHAPGGTASALRLQVERNDNDRRVAGVGRRSVGGSCGCERESLLRIRQR